MGKTEFLFFKGVSKAKKAEFLQKLASGRFALSDEIYSPQPTMILRKQPDGLYKCLLSGKILSYEAIRELPGYTVRVGMIHGPVKVVELIMGKSFAENEWIKLIPFSEDEYIDSLLDSKNSMRITLSADPAKPFKDIKTGTLYSYGELQRVSGDDSALVYMDEETGKRFLQDLENWA